MFPLFECPVFGSPLYNRNSMRFKCFLYGSNSQTYKKCSKYSGDLKCGHYSGWFSNGLDFERDLRPYQETLPFEIYQNEKHFRNCDGVRFSKFGFRTPTAYTVFISFCLNTLRSGKVSHSNLYYWPLVNLLAIRHRS